MRKFIVESLVSIEKSFTKAGSFLPYWRKSVSIVTSYYYTIGMFCVPCFKSNQTYHPKQIPTVKKGVFWGRYPQVYDRIKTSSQKSKKLSLPSHTLLCTSFLNGSLSRVSNDFAINTLSSSPVILTSSSLFTPRPIPTAIRLILAPRSSAAIWTGSSNPYRVVWEPSVNRTSTCGTPCRLP